MRVLRVSPEEFKDIMLATRDLSSEDYAKYMHDRFGCELFVDYELRVIWHQPSVVLEKPVCKLCGGTGKYSYYYDASDHFSAGPITDNGWRTEPCPACSKEE